METKQRDTVYGYIRINYKGPNMINDIIQIVYQYYLWTLDSVILTDQNDIDTFRNLLAPKFLSILNIEDFHLELLYRNSRDGNNAKAFHTHCNGYLNTLTLVQSSYGHVFGGFTTKDWGGSNYYVKDDLAFLFRVKSKLNLPPKIFNQRESHIYAVFIAPQDGPIWGGGHDLCVQNSGGKSYSYLGWSDRYQGTGNELCGGDTHETKKKYYEFGMIDYEVFAFATD